MRKVAEKTSVYQGCGSDREFLKVFLCLLMLAGFILCGPGNAFAVAAEYKFSRYQIILDKKPFGEVAPSEVSLKQPELGDVIAKSLEMKSIIDDGSGIRIGLLDKKVNKNISLGIGEDYDGLELVSVNYDDEEAVLKKGFETAVLKLRPSKDKNNAAAASVGTAGRQLNPFAAAIRKSAGARKPFFTDLKKRRRSPFQPIGTNKLPFQAKPLDSFFKVSTGAFPKAQSPFGPFQAPQGSSSPGGLQPGLTTGSNAPGQFVPINPPDPSKNVDGKGSTINRLMQGQANQFSVGGDVPVELVDQ